MPIFYYTMYGLTIQSDIEIPEALLTLPKKADVTIQLGHIPNTFDVHRKNGVSFCATKNSLWFFIESVAAFYIEGGKTICFEPTELSNRTSVRAYLLGAAMGILLIQKNTLALHGSAVKYKEKAIILCGSSGCGKSTLATELLKHGCTLMADDTVAVKHNSHSIVAYPSYPQQKLCQDAALNYGYHLEDLSLVDDGRQKYAIHNLQAFCSEAVPIGCICEIVSDSIDEVIINELFGHEKLTTFINNIYQKNIYVKIGMKPELFQELILIVNSIPIYRIHRPLNLQTTSQQAILLLNTFNFHRINSKNTANLIS